MTGSDLLKKGDMPPYMLPALPFASQALAATPENLPAGLKDYYNASKSLIGDYGGEDLESFVQGSNGNDAPNNAWKIDLRPRPYTEKELSS
jgi:hypothetical protein